MSDLSHVISTLAANGQLHAARLLVRDAAQYGRAEYLPAGARDNDTARVLVDGQSVGQASTLMHLVQHDYADMRKRTGPGGHRFATSRLLPTNY